MESITQPASPFLDAIAAHVHSRTAQGDLRRSAYDRFDALGLPHRRVEGWRWSDFHAVLRQMDDDSAENDPPTLSPSLFSALNPLEIRIIDGWIVLPDDEIDGVRVGIPDANAIVPALENHPLGSLNVAMTRKCAAVDIGAGAQVARPILFRHIHTSGGFVFSQSLLRLREGATATVIETHEGPGTGFHSTLGHGDLRKGARLRRYVFSAGDDAMVRHGLMSMKLEQRSRMTQAALSFGGALDRDETYFWGAGDDVVADIDSAALLARSRHHDVTTNVRFHHEGGMVRQRHKAVATDRGRNVFQGKFHVDRAGQKTDAQMAANALLLSETAEANHKPELEIYADDVECAHGSTAGALDRDALFYLRQRGLSETAARALLVEAFVGEVVSDIDDDGVRGIFETEVQRWLTAL